MAGTIEKRGENSWRLTYINGINADGKQIRYRKTVKAKSPREVEKLLALMIAEIEQGQFINTKKLTFADFVTRWFKDYGENNLAPKTLHRYKQLFDSRILPALGHYKIEQIKPVHILEFYNTLINEGTRLDGRPGKISEQTVLYHHRVISAVLQDAVEWQVIPYNPAKRVKPPKVKKTQGKYYDEEQTATLLHAVENEAFDYRVILVLAISTGLRRGELMGLEWSDIDFEKLTLTVRQVSQYIPGKGIFTKEPKNETSKRTVSLPLSVVSLVKDYRKEWAENRLKIADLWQGSDRLFVTWDGNPMHPDTVSKWFPKFLKKHHLPSIPFHGLRHTAATLLIKEGLHAKTISSRLGHSNINTTMNIYGHALKSADKEAADKLNHIFTVNMKRRA